MCYGCGGLGHMKNERNFSKGPRVVKCPSLLAGTCDVSKKTKKRWLVDAHDARQSVRTSLGTRLAMPELGSKSFTT